MKRCDHRRSSLVVDAAYAAVLGLEWSAGPINVVDDEPAPETEWLPDYASVLGARPPPVLHTRERWERGISNAKARHQLGWQPPPVPRPARPSVTELCRHEIPDSHRKEGCVLLVELPPGVHDGRHRHPGAICAHVLQGTVVSQAEGAPPQQHGPGNTWFEPPMQLAVRESNDGWETAKLLIFDLAERDQLLEFAEAAEE